MSFFDGVKPCDKIEIFDLLKAYKEDPFEKKVNLSIGTYRNAQGKPWLLPVVRTVEKTLAYDESLHKEYFANLGLETFIKAAIVMLLGDDSPALIEERCFGVQCLSGTGALRIGAEILSRYLKKRIFYYSKPTWENHKRIFISAGFTDGREYRYWNNSTRALDIDGLLEDLQKAPDGSVIILHACGHNPTGMDPSKEEWEKIIKVMKEKKLIPCFDSAYQGFASGDLGRDAYAVRRFVAMGFEVFCAQSFSKSFGIENERVGNLTIVLTDASLIPNLKSHVSSLIRSLYLCPPSHGARIVAHILNNPDKYNQFLYYIKSMAGRVNQMRIKLREDLEQLETPGDWRHVTRQIGMYSYTGLTEAQAAHMVNKYHIYMMRSGRINLSGLNNNNVFYVAKSINESVISFPADERQIIQTFR